MSVDRPSIPTEDRLPAWRAACLSYRAKRSEGASDQEAHEAAVAAVQSVLPLPWKEASAEAVNAVAYARPSIHSDGSGRRPADNRPSTKLFSSMRATLSHAAALVQRFIN
jgi:hypothetical protein